MKKELKLDIKEIKDYTKNYYELKEKIEINLLKDKNKILIAYYNYKTLKNHKKDYKTINSINNGIKEILQIDNDGLVILYNYFDILKLMDLLNFYIINN